MSITDLVTRNALLASVDADALESVLADLEHVPLRRRQVLAEPGDPRRHIYFIAEGIVSRVGMTGDGRSLELAVTGREGAIGVPGVLGIHARPYRVIVQVPGAAFRMESEMLGRHAAAGALRDRLITYADVLIQQLTQAAVCARFHTSRQRLSRWLLDSADRAGTTKFPWSHEWIAEMVGGPRSAVSAAASALRKQSIIEYSRGGVLIRDLDQLRATTCECFGIVRQAVRTLLPELPPVDGSGRFTS